MSIRDSASAALRTLQVDAELSPLVRRTFRLTRPQRPQSETQTEIQVQSNSQILPSSPHTTNSATTTTATTPTATQPPATRGDEKGQGEAEEEVGGEARGVEEELTVLQTEYRATTNRMLRVAVNGFMESLGVVLGVMEELDVDVLKGELGAA
ncbi:hypothetical protein ACJ73_06369 [Blastomyces percursus]|uniref:Uncharacterized protein n=1 Tax=Blastomyces percursus TaxID=1658174 RepID=A0A1J9Q138_9EURO|nr:hypothetical protein ACJ73_06369 [Blastomyces percursus]